MASAAADWMTLYQSAASSIGEVGELLKKKQDLEAKGASSTREKAQIRKKLTQLKEDMEMLDRNLRMMQGSPADFKVGSGEITRRQGLVHSLGLDIERFTAALEGRTVKKELMGDARPDKKAVETTETMGLDSRQLYDKHLDKKAAQDKAIDDILVGVTKVKQIGQDINDELTLHEQLLDDIDQGMDRVENRLKDNTKATKQIRQKDKSWFGFGLMILLFIVILVLIFI